LTRNPTEKVKKRVFIVDEMKKDFSVIVLGYTHSGTSMVAGVIHKLGISMGEKLKKADKVHPLGFFEDVKFVELNDRINAAAFLKYKSKYPLAKEIMEISEKFEDEIRKIIEERNKKGIRGLKHNSVPVFHKYIREPHYVIVKRKKEINMKSCMKKYDRNHPKRTIKNVLRRIIKFQWRTLLGVIMRKKALKGNVDKEALSKHYDDWYEYISNFMKGKKHIYVKYEEFLKCPEREIKRLIRFLEISPTKEQVNDAMAVVRPDLNRAGKLNN